MIFFLSEVEHVEFGVHVQYNFPIKEPIDGLSKTDKPIMHCLTKAIYFKSSLCV